MEERKDKDYDAVGEFVCDSRNPTYNQAFFFWRRTGPASFTYRFVKHGRERVFVDGAGFLNVSPGDSLRNILANVSRLLGGALILLLVCQVGGGSVLAQLFAKLGMDVQLSMISLNMFGSQWAIVALRMSVTILKYLLPTIWLLYRFQLPWSVFYPARISGSHESLFGASAALLCGIGISILSEWTGDNEASRQLFYDYKDTGAVVTYYIFDIFIGSMLAEVLYRGVFLQVLRQFGDWFAILSIALMTFLMPNELPIRLGEILVSILSGYCLLRTGSILTCVLIRILYVTGMLAQLVRSENILSMFSGLQINLVMCSFAVLGIAVALRLRQREKRTFAPLNRVALISHGQKLTAMLGTTTMLPAFAISVILTIIQLSL